MIDVDALVAWLNAQVDEDERVALSATPGAWRVNDETYPETVYSDDDTAVVAGGRWGSEGNVFDRAGDAHHIARHNPTRALRQVEAHRQIIARYQDALARTSDFDHSTAVAELQVREYEDFIIPALLAAYVDRPGFDPSWLAGEEK